MSRKPTWTPHDEQAEVLEKNWLFTLKRTPHTGPDGKSHPFYVVDLPDAVHVVALTADRRVVLVRQFRAGSRRMSLETPGGLLEPGEDPIEAARRELREETGYTGGDAALLCICDANPSIVTARIATVLIQGVTLASEPSPDEHEHVEVELVSERRIPRMIASGEISHALAIQGLQTWLIGQIPDNPLVPPALQPRRRWLEIQWLMGAIAVSAVAFWIMRGLGRGSMESGAFGLTIPLGAVVAFRALAPRPQAVLLQPQFFSARNQMFRLLAAVGLILLLFLLVSFVLLVRLRVFGA